MIEACKRCGRLSEDRILAPCSQCPDFHGARAASVDYFAPTFGQCIRAARLGFHWSAPHRCFIRMSTVNERMFIEMVQREALPNKPSKNLHRIWWDPDEKILALSPALEARKPLTSTSESFYVNDNGVEDVT